MKKLKGGHFSKKMKTKEGMKEILKWAENETKEWEEFVKDLEELIEKAWKYDDLCK